MESILLAVPLVVGAATGASIRAASLRANALANFTATPEDDRRRLRIGLGLVVAGVLLSGLAVLLQAQSAEKAADTKAGETVAVECLKGAVSDDADPDTTCGAQRATWRDDASSGASTEGLRSLVAALGTTILGLGLGDLIIKPLAK